MQNLFQINEKQSILFENSKQNQTNGNKMTYNKIKQMEHNTQYKTKIKNKTTKQTKINYACQDIFMTTRNFQH